MGIPVLVLGASGTGKSASLRNFKNGEIGVLNVAGKPLPFKSDLGVAHVGYNKIAECLGRANLKSYCIDDSQYLMAFDLFNRAKETGYAKFTDMAQSFYLLIKLIIDDMPDDCIVYLLHHTELSDVTGKIKAKTIGKMLDEKLCLEGLFSIVLHVSTDGKEYIFETRTDGNTPTKTPMGMFSEPKIENDLKFVDRTIREYYELSDNEIETKKKVNKKSAAEAVEVEE